LDLSAPETLGLFATRNFYLRYEDEESNEKVSIAAWHVIPAIIAKRFHIQLQLSDRLVKNITNDNHSFAEDPAEVRYKAIERTLDADGNKQFDINDGDNRRLLFEEFLRQTTDPIILYLHGNTGTRGNSHRVDLYKVMRRLGYHVIAIDYRGFGDSSQDISPSEKGCVNDALETYKYIKNLTSNPIFVFCHSLGNVIKQNIKAGLVLTLCMIYFNLGTGIGLHMASIVDKSNIGNPHGVILEAPFNNMRDEIIHHPFSWVRHTR